MRRLRLLPLLLVAAPLTLAAPTALADILPEPQRPAWNEEPPPMPEPPPEKELDRRAIPLVLLGLIAAAAAAAVAQRRRAQPGAIRRARG